MKLLQAATRRRFLLLCRGSHSSKEALNIGGTLEEVNITFSLNLKCGCFGDKLLL
jgi:hypothetical protein